ncbi:VIN3-like protein 1 [Ananas comosus]|uniref:VIN3-like protein 1 n=1 Tax=Ananas comosus TaxID=4615 RepID=A0A6P5H234_ANACO|nr:VIN3-like protein 1 [Ananas comosus]XP_020114088.1 VIN3-like protein 1 [Ananas comosus]XP_020114089.1 VIN3-like protein 1 [Ananas comosus]
MQSGSLKHKVIEEMSKTQTIKGCKNIEQKKISSSNNSIFSDLKKQPRNGEFLHDTVFANTWTCKNSACKAVLSSQDTFCRRCSCCICHLFDENKDPSLWLVCESETDDKDCCGLSCHIDCALQHKNVGCVDLGGQTMHLDGSYCCASCGKVSGILGCWRRQLVVAKDARRVDVLCHRIHLSYRLLDGTSNFKELHQIVKEAKAKLETEVGPLDGVSAHMARSIVSRLSAAVDVQKLCSLAVEKANDWLRSSQLEPKHKDALPAACRFRFEDITSSSLVIVLKETFSPPSDAIKGYKLWYWKSREEQPSEKEPIIFTRAQRRILIYNLQPCTEYAFRIISFTENADLGHSGSKCFTKSVEIIHKQTAHDSAQGCSSSVRREGKKRNSKPSSGFKIRNVGKFLRLAWAQEECSYDELFQEDGEEDSCGGSGEALPETAEEDQATPASSHRIDLNAVSIPDLNAEAECSPDENGCSSEKNELVRSNGSDDFGEAPAVESRSEGGKQPNVIQEETCDEDSTLVVGSPHRFSNGSGQLDDNYEYCVKVIRWLECLGHIEKGFRMKFLTWFSLRSTEQERRVVITFIRTLIEEPNSLAGQLLDSFSEIVTCKRPRNGFCSKLWH